METSPCGGGDFAGGLIVEKDAALAECLNSEIELLHHLAPTQGATAFPYGGSSLRNFVGGLVDPP